MPSHCEPCPGKTNATSPVSSGPSPWTTPAAARSPASATSPSTADAAGPSTPDAAGGSAADAPTPSAPDTAPSPAPGVPGPPPASTTARSGSTATLWIRARATSPTGWSGRSVSQAASWAARAVRPAVPRPVTTRGTMPPPTASGSRASASPAGSGAGGACSMITCALVPLTPKPDTAPRRGPAPSGQSRPEVSSSTAPADQSTCPVGSVTFSVGGSCACRIACTVLITPATPAAACVWPMLDFSEPSHSGRSAGRPWP